MKTLHLNLKEKWFEMIFNGEKTEEYRDIKDHWVKRLTQPTDEGVRVSDVIYHLNGGDWHPFKSSEFEFSYYDTITFSNGYASERPQFEIELKVIEIKEGNRELGAEPGKRYFVLKLGKILNDVNCAKFAWNKSIKNEIS